jgi:hypothetical protein
VTDVIALNGKSVSVSVGEAVYLEFAVADAISFEVGDELVVFCSLASGKSTEFADV